MAQQKAVVILKTPSKSYRQLGKKLRVSSKKFSLDPRSFIADRMLQAHRPGTTKGDCSICSTEPCYGIRKQAPPIRDRSATTGSWAITFLGIFKTFILQELSLLEEKMEHNMSEELGNDPSHGTEDPDSLRRLLKQHKVWIRLSPGLHY
jgi:hypothetical protein